MRFKHILDIVQLSLEKRSHKIRTLKIRILEYLFTRRIVSAGHGYSHTFKVIVLHALSEMEVDFVGMCGENLRFFFLILLKSKSITRCEKYCVHIDAAIEKGFKCNKIFKNCYKNSFLPFIHQFKAIPTIIQKIVKEKSS